MFFKELRAIVVGANDGDVAYECIENMFLFN